MSQRFGEHAKGRVGWKVACPVSRPTPFSVRAAVAAPFGSLVTLVLAWVILCRDRQGGITSRPITLKWGFLMLKRMVMAAVLAGLLVSGATSAVQAQQPISSQQPAANPSGWTFNIAPYAWVASLNLTNTFNLPPALGGTLSTSSSVGFGDLLSHLNFGLMVAADARYDRFSLVTDFIYLNLGGTTSQIRSVNFPGQLPIPISGALQTSASLNFNAKIWTLAGGYTFAQGDWGNIDLIAGFRYLGIPLAIDYSLGLTLTGPRGNGATFGGIGSVSGSTTLWNGIGGFRGSVRIRDTGFFIPYYFDAGAGGSKLTWQISSGAGYHTSWADLSLTYRYLSFEQGSGFLRHLSAKGPIIMATFTF